VHVKGAAANVAGVPSARFYLSFAEETEFRGGCYVEGTEITEAIRVSVARGCNAGTHLADGNWRSTTATFRPSTFKMGRC
jgi:hypothetical protein